uniref:Histamine N-methyltransferase n=1 Tax=Neogobius melanostomus TaxID=47308 RepID=A0A8C6WVS4_9GOBI
MAAEKTEHGSCAHNFQLYLEHSGEHQAMLQCMNSVLPAQFKRIGEGKSSLDFLGVGSGGGEMDAHMLTLLQSTFPGVPVTSDIVEGSVKLTDNFKALVAKTPNLKAVPFDWHIMPSEDYMKQAKAKGDMKKFDFINMIQMMYYVEDMTATIQFYHGLLKKNGRLMIIVEAGKGGWDTLWKTFKNDLCNHTITEYRSSGEVKPCLDKLGLKYDEHRIHNEFDISECFDPKSKLGCDLLNFMTGEDDFYTGFTPETQKAILDLLKDKCSTQKDGKTMFNGTLDCILVHA